MASGSATGNPRNKVALKPGHSLMDWIRLCNSGADMSGTGGACLDVSPQLLASHNLTNNPWTAINGKVYNISRYLEFHPGGKDELMKGAGRDATTLFNNVHPWVNYEGILGKCLVGRLVKGALEESPFALPSRRAGEKKLTSPDLARLTLGKPSLRVDWYQKKSDLTIVLYTKKPAVQVSVYGKEREIWARVRLKEEEDAEWMGWECEGEVGWPPCLQVCHNKVELVLEKGSAQIGGGSPIWSALPALPGSPPAALAAPSLATVASARPLSHNVYLVTLAFAAKVCHHIPVGSHLLLTATIRGVTEERAYTPISGLLEGKEEENGRRGEIRLLVKRYPEGVFSRWVTAEGSQVGVSSPQGSFTTSLLDSKESLLLLAAGTGITPMVNIIKYALNRMDVQLKFFNRTEADIIWRDDLRKLSELNPRLSVEEILSEPGEEWTGRKGSLTLQMLESFLSGHPAGTEGLFIAVCGPHPFTHQAHRYLESIGLTKANYFCF